MLLTNANIGYLATTICTLWDDRDDGGEVPAIVTASLRYPDGEIWVQAEWTELTEHANFAAVPPNLLYNVSYEVIQYAGQTPGVNNASAQVMNADGSFVYGWLYIRLLE